MLLEKRGLVLGFSGKTMCHRLDISRNRSYRLGGSLIILQSNRKDLAKAKEIKSNI